MSYTLVCLVDDPATVAFAKWVEQTQQPNRAWFESGPSVQAVQEAVKATRRLLVVGHDGPLNGKHSLRAHATSGVWLDGTQLGLRFKGTRIYAWACWALGYEGTRLAESAYLGDEAVGCGASAVAGHAISVPGNIAAVAGSHAPLFQRILWEMISAFLIDEIDDAAKIKLRAREMLPLEISLEVEAGRPSWPVVQQELSDLIAHFHVSCAR